MKIALIVVENNKLSEPYKDFKENHKFLITDKGFIYPFGEDKHIECYDARIFKHLAKTYEAEITIIDTNAVYQEPGDDLSEEVLMNVIRQHEKVLKYIMDTRYASMKPMAMALSMDIDYLRSVIEKLVELDLVYKHASYWKLRANKAYLLRKIFYEGVQK